MNASAYGTLTAANTALANGTNSVASGALYMALEPCQIGHIIVNQNASGGFITSVDISKSTLRSNVSGGGSSSAALVTTNTSNFLGAL